LYIIIGACEVQPECILVAHALLIEAKVENSIKMSEYGKFWQQKMRTMATRLDTDKNGHLTMKDFDVIADRYEELGNVSVDKNRHIRLLLTKFWDQYLSPLAKGLPITPEVYADSLIQQGKKEMGKSFADPSIFFDVMDLNDDGFISIDEFILSRKILGIDEKMAMDMFKAIDADNDGKLSREEYMVADELFRTSENECCAHQLMWGPLV